MPSKTKCPHNRQKSICVDCGGVGICEHGRRRTRCKDCNGNSLCIHKREKSSCKECGSSSFCEHGRKKSICKDCEGSGICEHNKPRTKCVLCKGGSTCEHGKIKSRCVECKGGEICEHNKRRYDCKICEGNGICEHGIRKARCKKCKGSEICEHDKIKESCKDCKGSQICEHNRIRSRCKDCKGGQICEHNKIRAACKDCKGSQICIHDKRKSDCKQCGGSRLCKSEWCETFSNKKYEGYCFLCYVHLFPDKPISRNFKVKENEIVEQIIKSNDLPECKWSKDKTIQGGCSKRRPDLFCDLVSHNIIVEIDENCHSTYEEKCENKRIMEISRDLAHRPIVFIRFNPDAYTNKNGDKISSCWRQYKNGLCGVPKNKKEEWDKRIEVLIKEIKKWFDVVPDKTITIVNLFFD